jgi:hypothetical protein
VIASLHFGHAGCAARNYLSRYERPGHSVREKGSVAAHGSFRSSLTDSPKHRFTETPAQWKRCFGVCLVALRPCGVRCAECSVSLTLSGHSVACGAVIASLRHGHAGCAARNYLSRYERPGHSVREKRSVAAHGSFLSSITGLLKHRNTETPAGRLSDCACGASLVCLHCVPAMRGVLRG